MDSLKYFMEEELTTWFGSAIQCCTVSTKKTVYEELMYDAWFHIVCYANVQTSAPIYFWFDVSIKVDIEFIIDHLKEGTESLDNASLLHQIPLQFT